MRVLHADDRIVVVDKPAGLLVVPAPGRREATLVAVLAAQLGREVLAVHRLDEDTTGAMLFVLDDEARVAFEGLFRRHAIHREYLALLTAAPSPSSGRIESALQEAADGTVRVVERGGQRAVTHYETIERRGRCTLVRCRLETGRRNQIRVHMAALGCPLAGDRKYGYRVRTGETFRRVMLHSWRLEFEHPFASTRIRVIVDPPEPDLQPSP